MQKDTKTECQLQLCTNQAPPGRRRRGSSRCVGAKCNVKCDVRRGGFVYMDGGALNNARARPSNRRTARQRAGIPCPPATCHVTQVRPTARASALARAESFRHHLPDASRSSKPSRHPSTTLPTRALSSPPRSLRARMHE